MARKRKRSPQISGLIIIFLAVSLWAAKGGSSTRATSHVTPVAAAKSHAEGRGGSASARPAHEVDHLIAQKSSAQDSIRAALAEGRKRVAQLEESKGNEEAIVAQLEGNITVAEKYLVTLDQQVAHCGGEITVLDAAIDSLGTSLALRQQKLALRLRAMYRHGRSGLTEVLIASSSFADALYRLRYFRSLVRYDTLLMHDIVAERQNINGRKLLLEEKRSDLVALKNEKMVQQQTLGREKGRHQEIVAALDKEKNAYMARIRELEATQKELDALIVKLARQKAALRPTAPRQKIDEAAAVKSKGVLLWPVAGAILRGFGKVVHPVYHTITMNNGIDIRARVGEPVRSAAAGSVAYVGRMRGMGTFVVVEHTGGILTIYGRMGTVAVSLQQKVAGGAVIGDVGEGVDGETFLHFEVRKGAESVDPVGWLVRK